MVASCVVLVPGEAAGAAGTPESVGPAARTRFPVPVTAQFADVGTAEPPLLLHSAPLFEMAARPTVPVVVIVPP